MIGIDHHACTGRIHFVGFREEIIDILRRNAELTHPLFLDWNATRESDFPSEDGFLIYFNDSDAHLGQLHDILRSNPQLQLLGITTNEAFYSRYREQLPDLHLFSPTWTEVIFDHRGHCVHGRISHGDACWVWSHHL